MSMLTISTFPSTYPSPKLSSSSIPFRRTTLESIRCCNFSTALPPVKKKLGVFSFGGNKNLPFVVNSLSDNEGGDGETKGSSSMDIVDGKSREDSTMPENFRPLTKEAPETHVKWPYFVALPFLVFTWRTVLRELNLWRMAASSILNYLLHFPKQILALVLRFIGDPLTSIIRGMEAALNAVRAFYSQIVAYAPIPELLTIIILASAIVAIGQVAAPDSLDSQWHQLTIAGLSGYFAVRGMIGELFFWTILFGLFSFSRFVKKRDEVSSALPVAAVLAAVGEPWVRVVAIGSYTALAIVQYSKKQQEGSDEGFVPTKKGRRIPIPLLCAALAIGIRIAARWAGYRHLTWMVV